MDSKPITNQKVATFFDALPSDIRTRLEEIWELILAVGSRIDPILKVEETLKWGEPSYATIAGSPVRLGWKTKDAELFAVLFHCQSKLVSTFRTLYPNTFRFEGNRAIVFHKDDPLPTAELEKCLELALSYHKVKNMPLLGCDQA
ncbi:DUF1801 domain-containing protein [Pelagicoccus albus]|uniref:DUF1801 domain-containing protein n=1 Tax=Pelagicoccus albus TaxID=415222 RepID=A0A7X1B8C9_9BACT|nr:DUF1801 domain-containing protein [Pelagicoccus albus]MBC2607523.1 DUF1801 domain-containing protein [Pelagicoccus albus]